MKKLYLIRHAKSSWKDLTLSDFDRPLNKRGKRNAPFMAKRLKQKNTIPDIIISSPAKRAKKTAQAIAEELNHQNIIYDKKIYDSHFDTIDSIVKSLDDKLDIVFLVGHNPSLNTFVEDYLDFWDNIPTCGIIAVEFTTNSWKKIAYDNANLLSFEYPKMFK